VDRPTASGETQVFAVDAGGKLQPVTVKTGISDGSVTEIVDGPIREGQQVVIGEAPTAGATAPTVSPTLTMGPRL
jgi:HlyD family secretion protein